MKSKTNKNKTNKQKHQTNEIYATTAFKLLDFRQERIEILRDWNKEVRPIVTLTDCFESFQAATLGKGKSGRPYENS